MAEVHMSMDVRKEEEAYEGEIVIPAEEIPDLTDTVRDLNAELVAHDTQSMIGVVEEDPTPDEPSALPVRAEPLDSRAMTTGGALGRVAEEEMDWLMTLAQLGSASGLYPGAAPQELMMKAMVGHTVGLVPAQSFQAIDVIRGKPSIGAELQRALLDGWGLRIDQVRPEGWKPEDDIEYCWLRLIRDATGEVLGEATFTMKEAQRAMLLRSDAWKNWPSDMLFARATTRLISRFAPYVLYFKPGDKRDL